MNWVALITTAVASFSVAAQDGMVEIDLERNGASIPAYAMRHPNAKATLVLLPGGNASSGKIIFSPAQENISTPKGSTSSSLIAPPIYEI
jgi:hypothetical protein